MITIVTMCISGALAGLVGINELMGVQHRLLSDFNYGYGFGGIAVSVTDCAELVKMKCVAR
jgi:ABC-type uncharacterized transport system permease subunit